MSLSQLQRLVLHVGCGFANLTNLPPPFHDGTWREVRFDVDETCRPDIIGTVTDMTAVETSSMDAVFSSHNIEHVFPHEVSLVLREFHRVLKPDGFALVTCPDLQTIGHLLAEDKLEDPIYISGAGPIAPIDILYGHRKSIEQGNRYMAHRGGFTRSSLTKALQSAGFLMVGAGKRAEGAVNLWAYASKIPLDHEDFTGRMRAFFVSRG